MARAKPANNCVCLTCGGGFYESPGRLARGQGKYCEQACRVIGQRKRLDRLCEVCGKAFTEKPSRVSHGYGRFCGQACKSAAQRKTISLICETCGGPVDRTPAEVGARAFCSTFCRDNRSVEPVIMDEDGLTARVPLVRRDGSIADYSLIDAVDAPRIGQHRWYLQSDGYAARSTDGVRMHREVLGLTHGDGLWGDHIGLDKLDNRRSNLRVLSPRVSSQNVRHRTDGSSQYRGVAWSKQNSRWMAYYSLNRKRHHLGYFTDELEAAAAALAARRRFLPWATN